MRNALRITRSGRVDSSPRGEDDMSVSNSQNRKYITYCLLLSENDRSIWPQATRREQKFREVWICGFYPPDAS